VTSPLSFGQLSIWRSIETNPLVDGIRSQLTSVEPLPPGVTERQVRAAVETLWRRHESLRTTFEGTGHDVRQVLHPAPEDVVEIRALDTIEDLGPCARELFARPFTLSKEFGWRIRLLTVADGTSAVAISVHHILADGWSLRLLLAEFDLLLTDPAARSRLASPAPGPAALARQQHSDGWAARRSSARDYWNRLTDDFPPSGRDTGPPGERLRGSIDLSGVSGVVADLVDRNRVSAQTVILALFALGVMATTGRERIVVHLMVANRHRPDWHELVTSMNQIIPAGIVVTEADTFPCLLRQVETAGMAAMRNGCHDVDDAASITGRPPGSVVDHVLNYMLPTWPRHPRRDDRAPLNLGPSTRPAIAGIYGVLAREETPVLDLHVDSNLYPEHRLRGFLRGTEETLRLLDTQPERTVAELIARY
jgi:Condensation domain